MRFRNEMRVYFNFVTMIIMAATLFAVPMSVLGQGRLVRVPTREIKEDLTVIDESVKQEEASSLEAEPETACQAGEIWFKNHGNSTSNTYGNVRTYSGGNVNVKATAWSRTKGTGGSWATAFLGHYGEAGLGVTDRAEDGSDPSHRVDNNGRLNYVVLTFNQPVSPDMVQLESVGGDSDLTVYIGTVANAYNSLPVLSDSLLASFATESNYTTLTSSRNANINAGNVVGNVLIVAARVDDDDDYFKIANVRKNCQSNTRITFVKEVATVAPNTGASTQVFGFTGTGISPTAFNLVDNNVVGPDRITFNVPANNPITVTEGLTVGWSFNFVSCTGTSNWSMNFTNRSVTVTPGSGETVVCTFNNFQLGASAATATIAGRATLMNSRGVGGAIVTLQNLSTGETKSVITSTFGYYSFEDIEVSNFYMVSISHRRYRFAEASKFVDLSDNVSDLDFTGGF